MNKYLRFISTFTMLVMVITLLAACGGGGNAPSAPTAAPTNTVAATASTARTGSSGDSNLAADDDVSLLKTAFTNMKAATSYHYESDLNAGGSDNTAVGDVDVANNSTRFELNTSDQHLQVISIGNDTYISSDGGKTFTKSAQPLMGVDKMPISKFNPAGLDAAAAALKEGDSASESIDGVTCKHLILPATAMPSLSLTASGFDGSYDLCVAEDGSRIVQAGIAGKLNANGTAVDLTGRVMWSKLNEPVSITAPAGSEALASDATPTAGEAPASDATPTAGEAQPTAADTQSATPAASEGQRGSIIADTGFRADVNGFAFQNFGNSYPNTPATFSLADARRILGDKAICARLEGDNCTPSPAAQQWIDEMNKDVNDGHCEGFAVSSAQLFKGIVKVSDLGAPDVPSLQLDPDHPASGDPRLVGLISSDWVLQTLNPTMEVRDTSFNLKPSEVLDKIIAAMQNGAADPVTLSFWKPGFKEGHAVLPIWAEDKGNNIVWLHIYDNNYPKEDRYIVFDRAAQTWSYSTAADPRQDASAYLGDASTGTLAITPLSVRSQPSVCPFCANGSGSGLFAPSGEQMEQVMLDGNADLVFTDKNGHKFGYQNGKFVSDIPGADRTLLPGGLGKDHGPIYNLPEGSDYQISLDSEGAADTSGDNLAIFGQGVAIDLSGIKLKEGGADGLTLSADSKKFSYKPDEAESPEVKIASDGASKDYGFTLDGIDFSAGEQVDFTLDPTSGKLAVKDESGEPDKYSLTFTEVDNSGSHEYKNEDIEIKPGDTEYIDYGAWSDGSALNVEVDAGSDGHIDNTMSETDEQP